MPLSTSKRTNMEYVLIEKKFTSKLHGHNGRKEKNPKRHAIVYFEEQIWDMHWLRKNSHQKYMDAMTFPMHCPRGY